MKIFRWFSAPFRGFFLAHKNGGKEKTVLKEDEIDYWCKEYPELEREEIVEILEIMVD